MLTMPTLGIDHIRRMSFVYGEGRAAYDKAIAAFKKSELEDARAHLEAALAKDPDHLDARFLLARVHAKRGDHAAAVDQLTTALAADYLKYGPALAAEPDLAELRATPHGSALLALGARIAEEYARRVATGVWFVGRRSGFKWPKERGVQSATSRGELYAFDRGTRRLFRLTHTDHRVVAYVRSSRRAEAAVLGFDKIDRPPSTDAASEVGAKLASTWLQRLDTTTWQAVGNKVSIGTVERVLLGYGDDRLVVGVPGAAGLTVSAVNDAGKLAPAAMPMPTPHVEVSLLEARHERTDAALTRTWDGDARATSSIKIGETSITIPESGSATVASIVVSTDRDRVAFVTSVDPCAKDVAPSLYVADVRTGAARHVLTAVSRFSPRWIDATVLAYEDGDAGIRLWDAATGRQVLEIDNPPGIALDALSLSPAPRCVTAPVAAPPGATEPPDTPDDEPPLPPEEPVTKP